MEERKHLLDYLTQVFTIFGITILAISIICTLLGEAAAGESTMFRLGSGGIPVETVFQYLLTSICVTALRFVFFTDILIKKMSVTGRTVGMLAAVIVLVGIFFVHIRVVCRGQGGGMDCLSPLFRDLLCHQRGSIGLQGKGGKQASGGRIGEFKEKAG